MAEEIVFKDKDGGISATIQIYHDAEYIRVDLVRGSHVVRSALIKPQRCFLGKIYDRFRYPVSSYMDEHQLFEARVLETVKMYSNIAKEYVREDELQVETELRKQETTKEKLARMDRFAKQVKMRFETDGK